MKDLRGSELNPIALTSEDFEASVITPAYKVQIYKDGWKTVDGVTDLSVDFQGSMADGVVSSSLNLTVGDNDAKYHPLSGTEYSDYFSFRRKIRVFVGMKKGSANYTWSYFTGNINSMQHSKSIKGRNVSIKALDYCDILNTYKFGKDTFWGGITNITLQANIYEYLMPSDCKGIHSVIKDGIEYNDWTYNWETNKIAVLKEDTGTLQVNYFIAQNIITVLQKILLDTGVITSASELIYEPITKTINRVYFNEGTTALQAVKNLSQLVNYRFWFDGDGIPHFASVKETVGESDFAFKDYKNLEVQNVNIEDREFYNAVEVFGEERTRKEYYKEEIQLGSTVESSLDATTESRSHIFTFSNYGKLRYVLDCTNKNGLTSELNEIPAGAEITVTHNPTQSRAEEETNLGYVTGSLFYALSGTQIINTSDIKFIDHDAATRVRAVISDAYNKYGMQVSVTPESYFKTQLYLSHDPLRNLSPTVQTIGSTTGTASVAGSVISVPFNTGLWGGVKWETAYDNDWGPETLTGSGSWTLGETELSRIVTVSLSAANQGQLRWEGTAPANIPVGNIMQIYYTDWQIPAYYDGVVTEYISSNTSKQYTNIMVSYVISGSYLEILGSRWISPTAYQYRIKNNASSIQHFDEYIYGCSREVLYSMNYVDSNESRVRFKLQKSRAYPGGTFSASVYSKRKPYNVKVTNTKLTEFNAEFLAKCDFSTPSVTVTCKGQAPTPREYRIDLYGYKLVPRYYFLKLYGREIVSELSSDIYSQKSLTPEEIQETGGKKTLTVKNHLVQSQTEADTIAQNLLDCYSQIIDSFVIEVSCPPPLEVGDIVSIISQP